MVESWWDFNKNLFDRFTERYREFWGDVYQNKKESFEDYIEYKREFLEKTLEHCRFNWDRLKEIEKTLGKKKRPDDSKGDK